ncbi:MAG TPA: hypothetical protein VF905_00430, partial [Nitrospirota bacterium]
GQTIVIKSALPVDYRRAVIRWIKQESDRFYKAGFLFDACPAPALSGSAQGANFSPARGGHDRSA